ncbi:MAG: IPT/TIG domain-containing protein [Pyrinomonadaceae bacterium]
MKFLEGKTPAERNKTIAAIVLGSLAVVVLSYTFLFSGSSTKKSSTSNSNSNAKTTIAANNNDPKTTELPTVEQIKDDSFYVTMPIPENPFPAVSGGETSRNIFAIYVPPPQPLPRMSPIPPPSPVPTPQILVQFVNSNPNPVYAQQGDFTIELGGDKFTEDSKVLFNGQELTTQFASSQRLTAQVPAALITTEGQKQIFVRTPDGSKISNAMFFIVQAPPVPNYNFVGLVARKRYNNDTALLQDKSSKEYKNVRLGETVGRFKVVSISSKEVVMQDTALSFRHNLPYMDERTAARAGSSSTGERQNNDPSNNGFPNGFDPNVQVQYQPIPGIPNQYVQPPQAQPMPPQPKRDNAEDDDDEDN